MAVFLLTDEIQFPDPALAGTEGLLAVGGDLSIPRLLEAYRVGIFPWFNTGEPLLWWSPDPRYVLFPDKLHIPRSMRPILRTPPFRITLDTAFEAVIQACAGCRLGQTGERTGQSTGTWITPDMIEAYTALHYAGYAHSVEVWTLEGKLAGGLYGVSLGRFFFGESMFTRVPNASKYGFIRLVELLAQRKFRCIDCQQGTPHMQRFGAEGISRSSFQDLLAGPDLSGTIRGSWSDWTPGPAKASQDFNFTA